jgi:hypothetical protein
MQDAKHSCIAGDSRIDVLRPITYVIGWLGAGGANRTIILIGHKILSGEGPSSARKRVAETSKVSSHAVLGQDYGFARNAEP